jgi:hypothetical protein
MVHPAVTAFGVPIILMLCGATGKKLVRKTPWDRRDFLLGPQLALAALSSDLIFATEMLRKDQTPINPAQTPAQIIADATAHASSHAQELSAVFFGVIALATYFILLGIHQDWEHQDGDSKGQIHRLVIFSNALGIFLFAAVVFMVKGVR